MSSSCRDRHDSPGFAVRAGLSPDDRVAPAARHEQDPGKAARKPILIRDCPPRRKAVVAGRQEELLGERTDRRGRSTRPAPQGCPKVKMAIHVQPEAFTRVDVRPRDRDHRPRVDAGRSFPPPWLCSTGSGSGVLKWTRGHRDSCRARRVGDAHFRRSRKPCKRSSFSSSAPIPASWMASICSLLKPAWRRYRIVSASSGQTFLKVAPDVREVPRSRAKRAAGGGVETRWPRFDAGCR